MACNIYQIFLYLHQLPAEPARAALPFRNNRLPGRHKGNPMKTIMMVLPVLLLFSACSGKSAEEMLTEAEGLFKQRKIQEGAALVEKAWKKEPGNVKAVTAWAQVAAHLGRTNEAFAALETAAKSVTGDNLKQLASYRAYFFGQHGRRDEAVKMVEAGLKQWPGDRGFLFVKSKLATMPGAAAPDFSGTLLGGGRQTLAAYKGKVVLIDFWASWCGPCKQSMPHLKALLQKYAAKGLVVLGVNLDKTLDEARKFMLSEGISFPVIAGMTETRTIAETYGVQGIPATFLLDKQGVIRYSGHPMGLNDAEIEKLL